MATVLMRLQVTGVQDSSVDKDGKRYGQNVTFGAVYDPNPDSPNYTFSQATPSAYLTAYITNPQAFDFFKAGQQFTLPFDDGTDRPLGGDAAYVENLPEAVPAPQTAPALAGEATA